MLVKARHADCRPGARPSLVHLASYVRVKEGPCAVCAAFVNVPDEPRLDTSFSHSTKICTIQNIYPGSSIASPRWVWVFHRQSLLDVGFVHWETLKDMAWARCRIKPSCFYSSHI